MFNFKKKTNKVFQEIKQSFEITKNTNEVVMEIHEAFDTASEKLLVEAKEILSGNYDTEKGERLKKLGFTMSKKAVEANQILVEKKEKEYLAQQIEYFQSHYPNNKFITEAKVKEICKKYGLLMANTEFYISDIPEKNLIEIEKFVLRDEDCNKTSYSWWLRDASNQYYHEVPEGTPKSFYGYVYWNRGYYSSVQIFDTAKKCEYNKEPFKICASVKDFDTEHMRIEDGYKLQQNIPDPIVLQPVKGGYLIVSKWGLEGQDESLVNEKMN